MAAQPETLHTENAPATAHGRVWTATGMLTSSVDPAEFAAALRSDRHAGGWFFLPRQQTKALLEGAGHLGLDALAIEDVVQHGGEEIDRLGGDHRRSDIDHRLHGNERALSRVSVRNRILGRIRGDDYCRHSPFRHAATQRVDLTPTMKAILVRCERTGPPFGTP